MPKRNIDAATGRPLLTQLEQSLVDEYINNGGNGARAAIAAGYSAVRADQSAYQVLHRAEVQRHIRERIAESRVSTDEVIGTVASHMRGNICEFFDESGHFSIELASAKGLGHLIKSITETTREVEPTKTKPATVVRTCRAQLHSPLQAASILGRFLGFDRKSLARRPSSGDSFAQAIAADFKVGVWLDDLIQKQAREQGISRDAAVEHLLQLRPEIAKYLKELPRADALSDASFRDTSKALSLLLDVMIDVASNSQAFPGIDRVAEAHDQLQVVDRLLNIKAISQDDHQAAIRRIYGRLTPPERQDLASHPLSPPDPQQEVTPVPPPEPRAAANRPQPPCDPQPDTCNLQPATSSQPETMPRESDAAATPPPETRVTPNPSEPAPDPQPATCNLQPETIPQPATTPEPATVSSAALAQFEKKYARISLSFTASIGQHYRFVDMLRDIAKDETLTPRQAVDQMRLVARCNTWSWAELIEPCIAEYITLDPRFALPLPPSPDDPPPGAAASPSRLVAFYAPPPPPPPRGIDRYLPRPPRNSSRTPDPSSASSPDSASLRRNRRDLRPATPGPGQQPEPHLQPQRPPPDPRRMTCAKTQSDSMSPSEHASSGLNCDSQSVSMSWPHQEPAWTLGLPMTSPPKKQA